jgi:hypothetical protein
MLNAKKYFYVRERKNTLEGVSFQRNHAYAPDANIRWAPFLIGLFEISGEFSAPIVTLGNPYNM